MTRTSKDLAPARAFLDGHVPAGCRVLCAVSGGVDSMCLLEFVRAWGAERGATVEAAHFNHRLRGEFADRDEAFVRDWCEARGIPFSAGSGDTRALARREGLTIEEAARRLRYGFLERTAAARGCRFLLTAHHADDNAETILLNLCRGTGLKGLCGIPPVRGNILRPFLQIPRADLEGYAAARGLPHVEDETNEAEDAARNLLRHKVLPVLKEVNPRAAENMARAAGLLAAEDAALDDWAEAVLQKAEFAPGKAVLPWAALEGVPPAVRGRATLGLLARAGGRRRDLTAGHAESVLTLGPGGQCSLPYGLIARNAGGALAVERADAPAETVLLEPGIPRRWGDYRLTLLDHREGEGISLRPGGEAAAVGPCPTGAYLTLPGAKGGRSVKRLCRERGISPAERDRLPAIFLGGRLAAVWRVGTDAEVLPEGEPCRFIQIIKETEGEQDEQ